jgi:hypothetical protein
MHDLREHIRDFIDAGAAPVAAFEVIETQRQSKETAAHLSRATRSRRFSVYSAVMVVAVAVLLVAGLVHRRPITAASGHARSAATILRSVADEAAAQSPLVPGPGQFLYVSTLEGGIDGSGAPGPVLRLEQYYVEELDQVWSTPTGPGADTWEVVGQPKFVTADDRAAWVADGSQPLGSGYSSGGTATYYDVTDLPSDPAQIEAYFARQPYLTVNLTYGRDAAWQFNAALEFLQNGASPMQRSALLRFIASISGVEEIGSATTLGTDETGTLLSIPSDKAGEAIQGILDLKAAQLLEVRDVVTDPTLLGPAPSPSQVQAGQRPAAPSVGEVLRYSDALFEGIANSSQDPPSNAPPLPPVWPYGTAKEPEPGSVYP